MSEQPISPNPEPNKKRHTRRFFIVATIFSIIGFSIVYSFKALFKKDQRKQRLGPMVQMLANDSFIIVWHDPNSTTAALLVTTEDGRTQISIDVEGTAGRFEATVPDLLPGTTYHYEIRTAANELFDKGQARTSPESGGHFSFLAFGDSGMNNEAQYKLAKVMENYPVDLIVHTGDLVYMDGEREDYADKFYKPYANILKNSAFYPVNGNHDVITENGKPLFEAFVLPENGPEGTDPERHFWFDYGNVRFVGIDSDMPFTELHDNVMPWLDDVLADAAGMRKVVFCHHGIYTNGKYEPSGKLRTCVEPMCDKHNVELMLLGHNHMYERSHPIRNGQVVDPGQGTVHITTAAGGAKLYDIKETPMPELVTQYNKTHSFTHLEVTPEAIIGKQINIDNEVIDTFEIPTQQPATLTAPANG